MRSSGYRAGLWLGALGITALIAPGQIFAQSQVTKIDALVAQINRFMKQNPRSSRLFADVSEVDKEPSWRSFRNEDEMEKVRTGYNVNTMAFVWTRAGKVTGASFTFESPSGDWAHLITYYFRDDGSLAKIHAQLNTFYGDMSIIRVRYFNERGVLLKGSTRYLDLKTRKPKKPDGDFFDQDLTVYRDVRALPFHKLL